MLLKLLLLLLLLQALFFYWSISLILLCWCLTNFYVVRSYDYYLFVSVFFSLGMTMTKDILTVIFGNRFYRSTFLWFLVRYWHCSMPYTFTYYVCISLIHLDRYKSIRLTQCCILNEFPVARSYNCSCLLRALCVKNESLYDEQIIGFQIGYTHIYTRYHRNL